MQFACNLHAICMQFAILNFCWFAICKLHAIGSWQFSANAPCWPLAKLQIACQLHANCMQFACNLYANWHAICMQIRFAWNLHAICGKLHANWHVNCMQFACKLHAIYIWQTAICGSQQTISNYNINRYLPYANCMLIAYQLHANCLQFACNLHALGMQFAYNLHVICQLACNLHANCMPIACKFHANCMQIACKLHANCL